MSELTIPVEPTVQTKTSTRPMLSVHVYLRIHGQSQLPINSQIPNYQAPPLLLEGQYLHPAWMPGDP